MAWNVSNVPNQGPNFERRTFGCQPHPSSGVYKTVNTDSSRCTCYTIRNAETHMSVSSLKVIYYAFFHSVMSYGIIFWGNSSPSSIIFRIQKKAIRIMEGCGNRVSSRNLFKKLQILPLTSQYMLSLLMCVVQKKSFPGKQWKSQFRH